MIKLVVVILAFFTLNQVCAQTPDSFIGSWYAVGIHEVNVGDTVELMNGHIDVHDYNHFLLWNFNIDNRVKIQTSYRVKREKEEPTYAVINATKKWRYYKENRWLYVSDEKFKLISIDNLRLKAVRKE